MPTKEDMSSIDSNTKYSKLNRTPARKYWDLWGHTKHEFASLKVALFVLSMISILSVIVMIYMYLVFSAKLEKHGTIVVPGATSGIYTPIEANNLVAWDFSKQFATQVENYNAAMGLVGENVSSALEDSYTYLSPKAKEIYYQKFQNIQKRAISGKESSLFFPFADEKRVEKIAPGKVAAYIKGVQKKFIGREEISSGIVVIKVSLSYVPSQKRNPYGLVVDSYEILGN